MNFDCPSCHTPHSFPESEIPPTGVVVACTQCGMHIDLTPDGVNSPQAPATSQTPAAEAPSLDDEIAATGHMPEMSPLGPGGDADIDDGTRTEAQPAADLGSEPPPRRRTGPMGRFKKSKAAGVSKEEEISKEAAPEPAPEPAPKPSSRPKPSKKMPAPEPPAEDRASMLDLDPAAEMEPEKAPPGLNIPGFAAASDVWTWRDLPAAFMGVADPRRVLYTAAAFSLVFIAYFLLTWVGALLGSLVGILGTIFNIVAMVAAFGVFVFVGAIVAYVCFQTVIEEKPSSIKAGFEWAKSNIKSVVGTPLAFLVVIIAVGLVEGVVGFLGGIIPFAGPILWGLLSPAVVLLSLVAGLVAVAAFYSLPLYVPVVYNEQTGPVETLKRLLALFKDHGFKLVGYILLATLIIGVLFYVTVIPALTASSYLTNQVGSATMGGDLAGMVMKAPGGFALPAAIATGGAMGTPEDVGFGHTLGGIFAGIGGCLQLGIISSILMLAYYTSGGIIYSIVTGRRKNKA